MAKAIQWHDLELIRKLGEGQAGTVWLAKLRKPFQELPSDSFVAIKIYKSWVLEESGQFERIIRELEIGRSVGHPNLVKTFSIVRDDKGNPALVMSYYSGETLDQYLQRLRDEKDFPDAEAAFRIIGGLASVLSTLHHSGVIHRDVKPSNIILDNGNPILMDLGVIRSQDFPEQTTTGAFLGTIRYAAPEYLFGGEYDSRIDVYSLGAVAYELFVGETFLSKEKQWARLIIEKNRTYSNGIGYIDYSIVHHHFGIKATEFIRFLLKNLLISKAEERTLSLDRLSKAINNRLWDDAFFVRGNELVPGEPKISPINKLSGLVTNPKEVADSLRTELPEKYIQLIHRLLDRVYYGEITRRPIRGVDHAEIDEALSKFREVGVFVEQRTG